MKTKYKVLEYFKGIQEGQYNVSIKSYPTGSIKSVKVKNKSRDIDPEYKGDVECTVKEDGDLFIVKTENNKFTVDICELHAIRAAFIAMYYEEGGELEVVEKGVVCQRK